MIQGGCVLKGTNGPEPLQYRRPTPDCLGGGPGCPRCTGPSPSTAGNVGIFPHRREALRHLMRLNKKRAESTTATTKYFFYIPLMYFLHKRFFAETQTSDVLSYKRLNSEFLTFYNFGNFGNLAFPFILPQNN